MSGKPTSAVLPSPAASAVAPMRAFDQPSMRPRIAANAQPPRNTSHMAMGMNHRCESIFTLGMRSSTSAGSAMFSTHQLRRGARSGGALPSWRTIQPSTRQPSSRTSESSFKGRSVFRCRGERARVPCVSPISQRDPVMPLTKMEHYLVLTKDIDATRDFYCRVLGMSDGFRPPLGFPGYWLYLGDTAVI